MDIISRASPSIQPSHIQFSTVSGSVTSTLGGVARNVAEAAHRIRTSSNPLSKDDIMLISPLGRDSFGSLLRNETAVLGMRTDGLTYTDAALLAQSAVFRTAVCNMVLDSKGELVGGVADMEVIASMCFKDVSPPPPTFPLLTATKIAAQLPRGDPLPLITMLDANLGTLAIAKICRWAHDRDVASEWELLVKSTKLIQS